MKKRRKRRMKRRKGIRSNLLRFPYKGFIRPVQYAFRNLKVPFRGQKCPFFAPHRRKKCIFPI
jgi:hypothetical protein